MDYLLHHKKDDRPWGNFEQFTLNEATTVKLLTVQAGQACSLQKHEHRAEFWRVLSGSGSIQIGERKHDAHLGEDFFIPAQTEHRAEGGSEDLVILEIAFGPFDENDITRLEDRYGRV